MTTALVLGGGGIAGIAWEVGVIVGLRRAGVDLTGADLVVGTSAGSVVGALIATGVDLERAIEERRFNYDDTPAPDFDFDTLGRVFGALADQTLPQRERLQRVGAIALAAPTRSEEAQLAYFRHRLPYDAWPTDRRLLLTGVDTESGEFVVWDHDAGVPLVAAVAASCAVPGVYPPVTLDGRRYMDGGMRSGTNADLAAGAKRIVVIAPLARMSPLGAPRRELEQLRRDAEVLLVVPSDDAVEAFGPNVLDSSTAKPSLAAGLRQGAELADEARAIWP